MKSLEQNSQDTLCLFRELLHFGLNINLAHGPFNNCLPSHLLTKKKLEKLSSIYDLNLFRLNALEDPNAGDCVYNHRIHRVRWPTTAIHKYILYYCILYLSTQTYSLAVRVYLPVQ